MASRTKTLKLDDEKEVEAELWKYLQTLPHGEFSLDTKAYWFERLEHEKVKQERLRKIERESEVNE